MRKIRGRNDDNMQTETRQMMGKTPPWRPPMLCATTLILALSIIHPLTARSEEVLDGARQAFELGRQHEERGEYEEALTAYLRAQQLRPTFRLHRYLGQVCQSLARHADAIAHYSAFLLDGGEEVDVARRRQIEEAISTSRHHVARITVDAPAGAAVEIDGIPVGRAPLSGPIDVDEGERTIAVSLDGYRTNQQELTFEGGVERSLEIELSPMSSDGGADAPVGAATEPPEGRRRLSTTWFWTGLALSVATLGTGAVLGGLTLAEEARFDDLNRPDRTDAEDDRLLDTEARGEAMGIASDVLLFSGAALAVATVVLALFTDFRGSTSGEAITFLPTATAGGLAFGLFGGF